MIYGNKLVILNFTLCLVLLFSFVLLSLGEASLHSVPLREFPRCAWNDKGGVLLSQVLSPVLSEAKEGRSIAA